MRILHVIDSADPAKGGPIEGVKQLAGAMHRFGHTVEVACADNADDPWIKGFPLPIHALGPAYTPYRYAPEMGDWLLRHLNDYDAVVVDGLWQSHGRATRSVARRLGREYFVFSHGMLDPWFKRTYPRKHLKKVAYWRLGEYLVLRDAKSVLFTCEEEARLAPESFTPNTWRSTVVSFGTAGPPGDPETERTAFLTRFPELKGKRFVLFFGRIAPKKGVDLLLAGFAAAGQGLHLVIAGPVEPELGAQLHAQATALGLEGRITWTGMLTGDERWGAYRAAEVFALISHQENFGVSVVEALACGVPVLLSDKVNIWREIEEGKAGLIAGDTLEGAEKLLQKWIATTPETKAAMRENALTLFQSKFEVGQAAQNLLRALEEGRP